ncbi:MAG: T9SS type A sorting domain-containing protein, partial [Bacteroidales bacterium]|nr:T9SS type A sorting domain-containing protein [Bacteroidales bacterium]
MNIVEDCGESGIEDVNGNASINIYPNPAKDVITLDIEHLTLNNADAVVIFNTAGQVVYKSNIQNQISQIDVSSLKNGVYYIKVGNTTKKLIIK